MSDCRKCARFVECAVDEDCGLFVKKTMTNADRIRVMTDEELAAWINQHDCHTNLYGYDPKDAILDWLKEEGRQWVT